MGEPRGSFDVVRTIYVVREPCETNHVHEPKKANANRTMRTEIVFVQNGNHGSQYGSPVRKFVNPTIKNYNKILYIIKTINELM